MDIYYKKILLLISLLLILTSTSILAQKSNYISIVVPEEEETITTLSRYRLACNTLPNSSVQINGKKLKVYTSGAVVDLMKLRIGKNEFVIKSKNKGKTVSKKFVIIREKKGLETSSEEDLVIDARMMQPSKDLWLNEGDMLNVKVKGSPNAKVTFLNGIEMYELPKSQTKGVGGIYIGTYKVGRDIKLINESITFKFEKDGEIVEKKSKGLVTINPQSLPRVGVTIADRPSLSYGLGTNRLGGAKLSFIEKGIKLAIDGKVGDQYRVRLTDNHEAWIPVDQVELLPVGTYIPKSLTESWAVYGGTKSDKIVIRLNEKLPYSTRQEINPTRIIVDIYGATSNSNWITQHLNLKEVKNLYYEQAEKDLFRVIIEPKHKNLWGYKLSYKGTALEIKINKQPSDLNFSKLSFILDAGHGGDNNGALGSTGLFEKDVTFDIVKRLKKALVTKGAKVHLTREEDVELFNSARLKKINNINADMLISIHANSIGYSSDPKKISGTSTFYKHICYRPISVAIYKRMLELGLKPFGNVGNFNFTLNSPTEIPNVLVEAAFMSNPNDEMKLMDSKFKDKMVQKIIQGIQDYLYECEDNLN